mgnify:CR=1 FL=1
MLESIAVIASLDDVAMVGQPVQQGCGHLRVAEYAGPLREAQVGRDQDAGFLIQLADQVKQQGPTGLAEWEVAQFIEDHQIGVHQPIGQEVDPVNWTQNSRSLTKTKH